MGKEGSGEITAELVKSKENQCMFVLWVEGGMAVVVSLKWATRRESTADRSVPWSTNQTINVVFCVCLLQLFLCVVMLLFS